MNNPADRSKVDGAAEREMMAISTVPHPADTWSSTYDAACCWVRWTARRRWPRFAANDDVWAASVADWWHGPGRGGRRG